MKVEFLFAWEQGNWTTEVIDVPCGRWKEEHLEAKLYAWARANLMGQVQYRRAVAIVPYCFPFPDQDEDDGDAVEERDCRRGLYGPEYPGEKF
jgi:hypothetical protein